MTFGEDARRFVNVYESNGEVMFVTALGSQLSLLDVVGEMKSAVIRPVAR